MIRTALLLVRDLLHFAMLACSSRTTLAAEKLFLRKQLAFDIDRKVNPRRLSNAVRIALVVRRQLLVVVQPETLVRWNRRGFRPFWKWKSRRPGRPPTQAGLRDAIADMARANRTRGGR
jgi:putative transposase